MLGYGEEEPEDDVRTGENVLKLGDALRRWLVPWMSSGVMLPAEWYSPGSCVGRLNSMGLRVSMVRNGDRE